MSAMELSADGPGFRVGEGKAGSTGLLNALIFSYMTCFKNHTLKHSRGRCLATIEVAR